MDKNNILLVEDDTGISNSLKLYLENSGFNVFVRNTGEKTSEYILDGNFDLIVLDINLPGKDGISICRDVRKESNIPIIMLTARSSELDKVIGLEIGADDYISKPFSPRELLARINSILRRVNGNQTKNILKYEDIELDLDKYTITKNQKEINLTKNEFEILKKIMQEDGKIIKRETLMTDIIGYEHYAFDRTIDTHIKNLRKKIGIKDMILTIRGQGYRLNK